MPGLKTHPCCVGRRRRVGRRLRPAGSSRRAGPFTAAQAAEGRAAYDDQLRGLSRRRSARSVPPALGGLRLRRWLEHAHARAICSTRSDRRCRPIGRGRSRSRPTSTSSPTSCSPTAAPPGKQPLTATTDGSDRRERAAARPPAQAAAPAPAGAQAPGRRAGGGRGADAATPDAARGGAGARRWTWPQAPPPTGLTVAGEVRNFTRVTDEMLRNPPPNDWPCFGAITTRRTTAR